MSKDDLLALGYTQFTPVQLAKSRGFSCGLTVAVQCPVDPLTSIGILAPALMSILIPLNSSRNERAHYCWVIWKQPAHHPTAAPSLHVSLMASAMSDLALLFDVV